jgi:hypothetical protein
LNNDQPASESGLCLTPAGSKHIRDAYHLKYNQVRVAQQLRADWGQHLNLFSHQLRKLFDYHGILHLLSV